MALSRFPRSVKRTVQILSMIVTALSISLIIQAYAGGRGGSVLSGVAEQWDHYLRLVLSIPANLASVTSAGEIDPPSLSEIGNQWPHLFVLLLLYFWTDGAVYFHRGKPSAGSMAMLIGLFIALMAVFLSTSIPLPVGPLVTLVFVASSSVIAYELMLVISKLVHRVVRGWNVKREGAQGVLEFVFPATLIGYAAVFVAYCFETELMVSLGSWAAPVGLFGLFAAIAGFRLGRGIWTALTDYERGDTFVKRFQASGSARLALTMLGVMAGGVGFFHLAYGANQLGL